MTTRTYSEQAELVAQYLTGTCASMEMVLEHLGFEGADQVMEFCVTLDRLVFSCTTCGWWMHPDDSGEDVNGQWVCFECSPEEQDDE